jgi:hypothetical protein
MSIVAIIAASLIWFVLAGALFFNPIVDKIYRKQDHLPGVKALPPNPKSIGLILGAIFIQIVLWEAVYVLVQSALPGGNLQKGLVFGLVLVATKMVPRDADRLLLSTYPQKRMLIEFIIGSVNCFAIGLTFAFLN